MRRTGQIANDLLNGVPNGGATVPTGHGLPVPTTGFVVAVSGHERRIVGGRTQPDFVVRQDIVRWVALERAALSWYSFAGLWVDGDDIVLDVVEIVAERATAERLGRERGQDAIYDLGEAQDIHTGACQDFATVVANTWNDNRVVRADC